MDFRYRLAKKTFKNKKIPQKRAPGMDVISNDQRGDDSSPEISPLSLDKHTITPKPKLPEEEKQLSRRDLFSFGNFMKSAAELDVKPIEEQSNEETDDSTPSDDCIETPAVEYETDSTQNNKQSFFKRLISRFRSSSKQDEKEHTSIETLENELTEVEKSPPLPRTAEEKKKTNNQKNKTSDEIEKIVEEEDEVDPEYDRR
ncbi:uncharacterized protein METZ01_LOCUS393073, partial [marine metagenome]